MRPIMIVIWIVAIGLVMFFIHDYLYPYILRKIAWYKLEKTFKRLKKKYPDDADAYNEMIELTKEINKDEKL